MNKHNLTKEQVIDMMNITDCQKDFLMGHIMFLYVSGSHAYGMNTEDSDLDIRGIFVADPINIIGNKTIEQFEDKTKDIQVFEFKKFINLLKNQNPNILEQLWCDEEDIIYTNDLYWDIRKERDRLLSSKCYHTFSGYAMSQLKRIRGHNKWLEKERKGEISLDSKPDIYDYIKVVTLDGVTLKAKNILESWEVSTFLTKESQTVFKVWECNSFEGKQLGWFGKNNGFKFQANKPKDSKFKGTLFFNKDSYDHDLKHWNEYKTWKENRNEKRHDLEKNFGYDTKHASHLVRMMRMGKEILQDHKVIVKRPDAQELLNIRKGGLDYDSLIEWAENMDSNVLPMLYKETTLRHKIDDKWLNEFITSFYLKCWKLKI